MIWFMDSWWQENLISTEHGTGHERSSLNRRRRKRRRRRRKKEKAKAKPISNLEMQEWLNGGTG